LGFYLDVLFVLTSYIIRNGSSATSSSYSW